MSCENGVRGWRQLNYLKKSKLVMVSKETTCTKRKLVDGDGAEPSKSSNDFLQQQVSSTSQKRLENNGRLLLKKGQTVYIRDKTDAWKVGIIHRVEGEEIHVKCGANEKIKCSPDHVRLYCGARLLDVSNLTQLSFMNEATVLSCLHERYDQDVFYTNAGSTIIAANPFREVEDLYSLEKIEEYYLANKTLSPHIYKISSEAYNLVVSKQGSKVNQCIVVSGESGAGKTVSAKHLLKFITAVANPGSTNRKLSECSSSHGRHIHEKILQSSPILEAFGNAATSRNDNSSRFGKFIELQFHRNGVVKGAAIQTYLLEKTRVVHPCQTECNFHIFYQLTERLSQSDGTTEPDWLVEMRKQLEGHTFSILPHGQEAKLNRNISDTLTAMTDIGLTAEHQVCVFEVLCAIIFLGNIDFRPFEEDTSSLKDDTVTSYAIEESCRLLGISSDQLEQALLNRSITSGSRKESIFVKPVSIVEAKSRRDCLAMLLYSSLFDWLLKFINLQIQADKFENVIGLLDIYGFETFETNSLEQLCINYANEKLQQHYIGHFLRDLQKEYEEECIPWLHIAYRDNQPCLNILEGGGSVFGILNEEVYLSRKSNPRALADRLLKLSQGEQCALKRPKTSIKKPGFIIQHYAGEVRYCLECMVTKNKDNIPVELVSLLHLSERPFVQNLLQKKSDTHSPGKKKKAVLEKFMSSLDSLMTSLNSSNVHYIRCIKPNRMSQASHFDRAYVMKQLEAGGIVETVKICQQGYAARISYEEFHQRYGFLISFTGAHQTGDDRVFEFLEQQHCRQLNMPVSPRQSNTPKRKLRRRTGITECDHLRKYSAAILQAMFKSDSPDNDHLVNQFGRTKVFLRREQLEKLESKRTAILSQQVTLIQRCWRKYVSRKRRRNWAARVIQKRWRRFVLLKKKRDWAAHIIQRSWKRYVLRKRKLDWAACVIQRSWRRFTLRKRRQEWAAFVIHQYWRRFVLSMKRRKDRAACVIQRAFRKHRLRQQLNIKLKQLLDDSQRQQMKENLAPTPTTSVAASSSLSLPTSKISDTSISKASSSHIILKPVSARDGYRDTEPTLKRLKLACGAYSRLEHVYVGDGIVTRRKIPKYQLKFHTRPSVLENAHLVPYKFMQRSLTDCLPDKRK
ncbi:unconventional myosin-XIX-like isoform X2 [Gigantopelta aegis]|uniref:unconventional myosin-XIX-like isoform X2 n=1 Tax=Gigantopelta aegis TaxID=1735272 RepID=UPI001B88D912|nr:unconventional myosin-XIX-like isoform X2 [Gigantopelta aegis]